jgi:hypothetical protein
MHLMAAFRHDTAGRAYYRRELADGKSPSEAIRSLKRRLSDTVYKQLVTDAKIDKSVIKEASPPSS